MTNATSLASLSIIVREIGNISVGSKANYLLVDAYILSPMAVFLFKLFYINFPHPSPLPSHLVFFIDSPHRLSRNPEGKKDR